MFVIVLRIVAGLLTLPAFSFAALTFMAPRKTLLDFAMLYPFWMIPALLIVTACGLWWTIPMRRLLPIVMALPIVLWLIVVSLVFAIAWLAS